jgi:hypothetical protein
MTDLQTVMTNVISIEQTHSSAIYKEFPFNFSAPLKILKAIEHTALIVQCNSGLASSVTPIFEIIKDTQYLENETNAFTQNSPIQIEAKENYKIKVKITNPHRCLVSGTFQFQVHLHEDKKTNTPDDTSEPSPKPSPEPSPEPSSEPKSVPPQKIETKEFILHTDTLFTDEKTWNEFKALDSQATLIYKDFSYRSANPVDLLKTEDEDSLVGSCSIGSASSMSFSIEIYKNTELEPTSISDAFTKGMPISIESDKDYTIRMKIANSQGCVISPNYRFKIKEVHKEEPSPVKKDPTQNETPSSRPIPVEPGGDDKESKETKINPPVIQPKNTPSKPSRIAAMKAKLNSQFQADTARPQGLKTGPENPNIEVYQPKVPVKIKGTHIIAEKITSLSDLIKTNSFYDFSKGGHNNLKYNYAYQVLRKIKKPSDVKNLMHITTPEQNEKELFESIEQKLNKSIANKHHEKEQSKKKLPEHKLNENELHEKKLLDLVRIRDEAFGRLSYKLANRKDSGFESFFTYLYRKVEGGSDDFDGDVNYEYSEEYAQLDRLWLFNAYRTEIDILLSDKKAHETTGLDTQDADYVQVHSKLMALRFLLNTKQLSTSIKDAKGKKTHVAGPSDLNDSLAFINNNVLEGITFIKKVTAKEIQEKIDAFISRGFIELKETSSNGKQFAPINFIPDNYLNPVQWNVFRSEKK